jgi:hypothetical protein
MRSGTSLVAQVVHRLGFAVAPYIPAPAPPGWRSDWEDPHLSTKLMLGRTPRWDLYIRRRKRQAAALGFSGVAIKSPYLSLHLEAIRARADALIVTRRDRLAQHESLWRCIEAYRLDQASIVRAADEIEGAQAAAQTAADVVIEYEGAVARPGELVEQLASLLDVHDEDTKAAAAALVGEPCLQSSLR